MRIMGAIGKRAILEVKEGLENVHTRKDRKLDAIILYAGPGKGIPLCSMVPKSAEIDIMGFHWNYEGLDALDLVHADIVRAIQDGGQRDIDEVHFRV